MTSMDGPIPRVTGGLQWATYVLGAEPCDHTRLHALLTILWDMRSFKACCGGCWATLWI